MDLQQLRIFRAAAIAGGFTRASEQLNLSQSTVSQHMKQLEESLGCPLFLRVGKRVYLNDGGKLLLRYTDRIFHELKNAEMAVRELNTLLRGTIRLGVGATTLIYMLPRVLSGYRRKYPQIELIVSTASTESLMQAIASQALDLAIVMRPETEIPAVQLIPILREELVVVVPSSHPLADKIMLQPADLHGLPLIGYFRDSTMRSLVETYFSAMRVEPKISMELENIEAIKSLVRAGLGASVLPLCSVPQGVSSNGLKILRVKGMPMSRELFLALPHSEMIPIAIRKLESRILKGLAPAPKPAQS
jgi:LysR family transcriptional activator of glutamate synthase operon